MIYIIRADPNHFKIGTTNNLPNRIKSLQTGNAYKIKVKAILEGGHQTEAGLHELLAKSHRRGEWFKATEELKWFIRAMQENPDVQNIYSLYRLSQQMRITAKAKRLGKDHKLSKRLGRIRSN